VAQNFAHGNYSHTQRKVRNGGGAPSRSTDRLSPTLSQNFLVDAHAVEQLVKAADPVGLVLEPGAGQGAVTLALARAGARVVGYELDSRLAGMLAARTRKHPRITVIRGDFTAARAPQEPFAVVGNIPYAITSQIVDWCLRAPDLTSATLLTQREYARKRTGDYGRWSLVTVESWPWFDWRLGATIGRQSFRPVPSVDSAILRIDRRARPLVEHPRDWQELVELGFGGVGGSLAASLATRYDGVGRALAAARIAPDAPVGHVHPDQWITLWERLHR
jgi:23S rRNA (adenine-N6)-dimethyltransferase